MVFAFSFPMKNSIVVFFLICLFSCTGRDSVEAYPIITTQEFDSIISEDSKLMLAANPVVYAINFKDSVNMNDKEEDEQNYFGEYDENFYTHDSLKIFVDDENLDFHTSEFNIFSIPPPPSPKIKDSIYDKENGVYEYEYEYDTDKEFEELLLKMEQRKRVHYKTYPVYIYNYGESQTVIQAPIITELFILLEAKNKNNEWKPIEYFEQYGFLCGTGHRDYVLKPKHYLLTTVKRYKGDYKTKLRVKFRSFDKVFYSNEFEGFINYSQFQSDSIIEKTKQRLANRDSITISQKLKWMFLND